MSEKFTASNGVEIAREGDEDTYQAWNIGNANRVLFAPHEFEALREFFLHERDQELGRWRWPENPNYVVYPVGDDGLVDVLRESSINVYGPGRKQGIDRAAADAAVPDAVSGRFYLAARAYFDAHPLPKPWHDAKPGEVWALGLESGIECAATREYGVDFKLSHGNLMSPRDERIVTGRRIWPEVS